LFQEADFYTNCPSMRGARWINSSTDISCSFSRYGSSCWSSTNNDSLVPSLKMQREIKIILGIIHLHN